MTVWLDVLGLNCQDCPDELRGDRGCEEGSAPGQWFLDEINQGFDDCPGKYATTQSRFYLDTYFFFKQGHFPNPGGWLDQPMKLLQAIKIISSEVMSVQEYLQKKGEKR